MKSLFILLFTLLFLTASAQLKSGFDVQEYLELLRISRVQMDTIIKGDRLPAPVRYHRVYQSPAGALKNQWDMWVDNHQTAAIVIRGSTADGQSWLENFYAAMVPASGQLHLSRDETFNYHLADDARATVHAGWLLGLANIAPSVMVQIKQLYTQQGIKNFIIMGHSQGAAIAYLLRSYLAWQQQQSALPADLVLKTYSSAPPKPGNIYYAYSYDYLTRGGWGLAVTNTADWVPQTPFSIQTFSDFNQPNPFNSIDTALRKQSFFVRLYIKHVYNQLRKPPEKAQRNDEKYLGHLVYKFIRKSMPGLQEPAYAASGLYTPCGSPVVLMPDAAYNQKHPGNSKNIFIHHQYGAYYELAEKEYGRP